MAEHMPAEAEIEIKLHRMERDPLCPTGLVREKDTVTVMFRVLLHPRKGPDQIRTLADSIVNKISNLLREDDQP